jgi:hypothetical protein
MDSISSGKKNRKKIGKKIWKKNSEKIWKKNSEKKFGKKIWKNWNHKPISLGRQLRRFSPAPIYVRLVKLLMACGNEVSWLA